MRGIVEGLSLQSSIPVAYCGRQPSCVLFGMHWPIICKLLDAQCSASASVNTWGKLSVYRLFKHCPDTERYVRDSLPVGVRRVLAPAACRYTCSKTPLSGRICKLCKNILCPSLRLNPSISYIFLILVSFPFVSFHSPR